MVVKSLYVLKDLRVFYSCFCGLVLSLFIWFFCFYGMMLFWILSVEWREFWMYRINKIFFCYGFLSFFDLENDRRSSLFFVYLRKNEFYERGISRVWDFICNKSFIFLMFKIISGLKSCREIILIYVIIFLFYIFKKCFLYI